MTARSSSEYDCALESRGGGGIRSNDDAVVMRVLSDVPRLKSLWSDIALRMGCSLGENTFFVLALLVLISRLVFSDSREMGLSEEGRYCSVTLVRLRDRFVAFIKSDACNPLGSNWRSNSGSRMRLLLIAPVCAIKRPNAESEITTWKKRKSATASKMRTKGSEMMTINSSINQIKNRYNDATTNLDGRAVTYCPMLDRNIVLALVSDTAEIIDQAV